MRGTRVLPVIAEKGLIERKLWDAYVEARTRELEPRIAADPGSDERLAAVVEWQFLREHSELREWFAFRGETK